MLYGFLKAPSPDDPEN